jgi:hypothetical protein
MSLLRPIRSLLLALLLTAPPVLAQSTEANILFDAGRKAMAARDYPQAIEKLQQSQKLDPAVGTLLNLAECYVTLGRTASAWSAYRDAASLAANTKQGEREKYATKKAQELEPQLSHLLVFVRPEARSRGLSLTRNGVTLPEGLWGTSIPVDPGAQHIEAAAPEHVSWTFDIDVADNGGSARVEVPALATSNAVTPPVAAPPAAAAPSNAAEPPSVGTLPPSGVLPATVAAPMPVDAAPSAKASSPVPVIGWIALAAGGVSLGAGVFIYADGRSKISDANCPSQICVRGIGDKSLHDAGRAHEKLGGGLAIAGAALAVGGVVLLLVPPDRVGDKASQASIHLQLEASASGLNMRGAF